MLNSQMCLRSFSPKTEHSSRGFHSYDTRDFVEFTDSFLFILGFVYILKKRSKSGSGFMCSIKERLSFGGHKLQRSRCEAVSEMDVF
jgi:hypothetical protein